MLLSFINTLYDSLGFVSRESYRHKSDGGIKLVGWDGPIDSGADLSQKEFLIRNTGPQSDMCLWSPLSNDAKQNWKMHAFFGASEVHQGAVVYGWWGRGDSSYDAKKLRTKSNITPMQSLLARRLELTAVVLAVLH